MATLLVLTVIWINYEFYGFNRKLITYLVLGHALSSPYLII